MLIQTDSGRLHRGYLPELVEHDVAGLARALDELLPFLGERLARDPDPATLP